MGIWTRLESQLASIRTFRPFFPALRTVGDTLVLPAQMARKGGRAGAFPFVVNITLTTRCNLRCPYCFNAENDVALGDELTLDEYRGLAARWAPHRPGVFLSGGEPFARDDLVEVVTAFKRRGMPVGIVTNGTVCGDAELRELAGLGLDALLVSFHGRREVHDRAVRMPGAFDRARQTLRVWGEASAGTHPMVNYVLTEQSVADLAGFADDVAHIRPLSVRLSHLNFLTGEEEEAQRRFWSDHFGDQPLQLLTHSYEPRDGAFAPLFEFLDSPQGKGVDTRPVLNRREIERWYSRDPGLGRRCLFVWRSTYLNAQGDVYPCQGFMASMGNVRRERLETIWNGDRYRLFRGTMKEGLMPGCARCCKL